MLMGGFIMQASAAMSFVDAGLQGSHGFRQGTLRVQAARCDHSHPAAALSKVGGATSARLLTGSRVSVNLLPADFWPASTQPL